MSLIHVIEVPRESGTAYSPVARLNVCSDRSGIASISVDPIGAIEFPSEVALFYPAYESEISGVIKQAGTITVTVTLNGVSDVVVLTVVALPYNILVGPETTLDYEGLPITFKMVASCDRPDTTLTLSSTGVGITIPPTVYCDGAPTEFEVTVSNYGEFTVTGEYNGSSSTALIHSINPDAHVYIGPDVVITEPNITLQLATIASRPGTGTISVSPSTGLSFPATVTFALGSLEQQIEGTLTELGDYVVTLSMDSATDTCSVAVSTGRHCLLTGKITDVSGRPVRLASVNFKSVPITQTLYTSVLSTGVKTAYTDRNGEFAIRLLRGAQLIASCEKTGYRKQITIPDQTTVDLKDL